MIQRHTSLITLAAMTVMRIMIVEVTTTTGKLAASELILLLMTKVPSSTCT